MSISEIKSMLSLSDVLIVGYDDGGEYDVACLTIARIEKDSEVRVLKCVHGKEAETMFRALIDT